jgi:hypothetical protein
MNGELEHQVKALALAYFRLGKDKQRLFQQVLLNPESSGLLALASQAEAAVEARVVPGNGGPPAPSGLEAGWQAFTLADAYQERPPVEYVAAGLFETPSVNIVYGAPGTLKSFLLGDLAICVAAGRPWLDPAPWTGSTAPGIPTHQVPVMWVDFDNGRRRSHDRFSALGRAHGVPADSASFLYYSMAQPWLDASSGASIGQLQGLMQAQGTRLLIIDNLGLVSGDSDENSKDMAQVMGNFRSLAEETGAAIVIVHHQRKTSGFNTRLGETLRGHTSIEGSLDLALLVEREEASDTITVKGTKERGLKVHPFSAAFTFESRLDGQLRSARFFGIVAEDTRSNTAIEKAIQTSLMNTSMNKSELAKSARALLGDVGINRIRDMIDRLAATGKLKVAAGKNNTEKIYSLA